MNIVFLAGAGGVGKTSVAQEALELASSIGVNASCVPSTTRASYAAMGIKDEAESRTLPDEARAELQERIFSDYCENLLNHVNRDTQLLLVDRSPYDYTSYFFQCLPNLLLGQVASRVTKTAELMREIIYKPNTRSHLWLYTYPTSWSESYEDAAYDGFRSAPASKNYVWSMLLEHMIDNHLAELGANKCAVHKIHGGSVLSPKERALRIMAECGLIQSPMYAEKTRRLWQLEKQ